MKFKAKCFGMILITILTALIPSTMAAADDNRYEYVLESYHIDMTVNEDNTLDITEAIGAYFFVPKHGIIRQIPLRNTVKRLDGTSTRNRVKISDINVNEKFTAYPESSYKVIKIGDPDAVLTGPVNCTIKYLYNLGEDPVKDNDELYFNLIGDQWDTTIDNITFRIEMPKEFDQSKLGFSYGPVGSVSSSDVAYSVQDNVISGRLNRQLLPGEALTVRLELPEGYFVDAGLGSDQFSIFSILISISFALIAFLLWMLHGKDDPVVETVEFYPPDGYNSAELGFFYKGRSNREDIISLLIYLANKGYLKIIEDDYTERYYTKEPPFRLVKLKDYDGDNEIERIFFDGLFKRKQEVTNKDLRYKFFVVLDHIVKIFKTNYMHIIFENSSLTKKPPLILMIIAVFCMVTIKPTYEYSGPVGSVIGLLFPGIGFTVMFSMLFGDTKKQVKIFGVVWGSFFGGVPWLFMVLPALLMDQMYLYAYIVGIACVLFLTIIMMYMPKRNAFGIELLGKIKGFRNFLETAEKPELEAMVMKDPTYFYDILPYTYVLGVSDKWIKKFESIALPEPDWYSGRYSFSYHSFKTFTDSTLSSMQSAMTSTPSSGGSGGGSSGGGSGGGGGSSW